MTTKTSEKETTSQAKSIAAIDKANNQEKVSEKPKYDKDELLRIFDEMIFSNEYVEEVVIGKRTKVKFRSRSVSDTTAISREIDNKSFNLITTLSEQRAVLNLVYSLVEYSGKDLSKMSIEDRTSFVEKFPAVIVGALSNALVKFDKKISAACNEGEENF